jgi:hypothetical protein
MKLQDVIAEIRGTAVQITYDASNVITANQPNKASPYR